MNEIKSYLNIINLVLLTWLDWSGCTNLPVLAWLCWHDYISLALLAWLHCPGCIGLAALTSVHQSGFVGLIVAYDLRHLQTHFLIEFEPLYDVLNFFITANWVF
uniref:Uncharacterized protein n=1 Tax=Glossina brevipalpis TaxID=37001 RepID=A0A1A9WL99_9MUSC